MCSFKESDLDVILSRIVSSKPQSSLKELLEKINQPLREILPCLTDKFSLLRYCLYLVRREQVSVSGSHSSSNEIHEIGEASIQFAQKLSFLLHGGGISELLEKSQGVVDQFLALMAIVESRKSNCHASLLNLIGESPYIDSMVGHILQNSCSKQELTKYLQRSYEAKPPTSKNLRFLLEIAGERKLDVLTDEKLKEYLDSQKIGKSNLCAVLRYIGERKRTGLLDSLHGIFNQPNLERSILYTLIDVIAQIGDSTSIEVLNSLSVDESSHLVEFKQTAIHEIQARIENANQRKSDRKTIIQCAFYGDLTSPGVSSAGGLSTFLRVLGDHLADNDVVETVYTLSFLPENRVTLEPLLQELRSNHFLIRIPVSFEITNESLDFLENEFEIIRAIRRALERYAIDPDIFHIRYTDNASKAVAKLANQLKKKVVFTLTPDPHATFVGSDGKYRQMVEGELLRNLNKVMIADRLIDMVDGLVLIGYNDKNTQVLPYFPQLLLDRQMKQKPLRVISEGVCFESCFPDGIPECTTVDQLTAHSGKFRIDSVVVNRPVILNVGRLQPLKGQHLLAKAWAESSFNEIYNLVIIGGDLENPNTIEHSIIKQIEETMAKNPQLAGRFSHIPALQNLDVRLLELSIIENIKNTYPNIYLCSSYKEEFGISIIEAMITGFLVIAPCRGGVSDYIIDGSNGFLIHTDDVKSIRESVENILETHEDTESLHEIAFRGQQLAQERLSIKQIGKDYFQYYVDIIGGRN
jgi:glycosyltransferase involved in cell wall biosynthesis